ncbi:SacI domain protein [Paecilomyces variotii No. 5]|uniref:SacI domain protein n=1 Tax=Byssochlamys spectabilis (strain No. 5 / NBRC 109023) TaxID=1356009 RepID=V5FEA0_BYSSN|nr:SacI domain protein [Paecilomyces variotii No. 5]
MPGLVRKLLIIAAVDGLILQPHGNAQRNASNGHHAIQIQYKTRKISSLPPPSSPSTGPSLSEDKREEGDGKNKELKKDVELEAHGIVGLLSVASYSFLVSITQREQVAQILGKPIYAVTNVAIIPLSSQADASRAILQAQENLSGGELGPGETASDTSSDASSATSDGAESGISEDQTVAAPPAASHKRDGSVSSIVEDVIGKKGRFTVNWFSRQWGLGRNNVAGKETDVDKESDSVGTLPGPEISDVKEEATTAAPEGVVPSKEEAREEHTPDETVALMPKLLRYTKLLFASNNFFFSYDYDLTRRFSVEDPIKAHAPLHTRVDPLYFWNKHLMSSLLEAGVHSFILPLMQGFVGQRQFSVTAPEKKPQEEREPGEPAAEGKVLGETQKAESSEKVLEKHDYLLTLISRRSIMRPGLRYLRRGVDDDGHTANTVETEQILSTPSWDPSRKVYSLLQLRGSIPIYFSQSPYSLKPVPVLHHSEQTNQLAFNQHFRELSKRYGKIQAVSLIDKHGGEAKVGEMYDKYAKSLNEGGGMDGSQLRLEWFDFHTECRGMKFENIKKLVDSLEETLDEYGETIIQNNDILRKQTGIVRTNCMDCLDRTGVAQCAFGGRALERELLSEGISIDLHGDSSTQWFNILWADNGDAISKQYSSTAALKGDYTRTRKRDYRGALNDFGLTMSRYFNNIVNDYFSQACIDYLLGNVSMGVFKEFEMELQSADPGISVQKLRQNAIETSCKIVIGDQREELLGGWTILTPRQPNTLRTLPFEECVLLLTDAAVYNCRFDWNTDKVLSFERIDLKSIIRIHYGTYITSVMTDIQQDEKRNVGLVIAYRDADENALRVNTRSLRSLFSQDAQDRETKNEWDIASWLKGEKKTTTRFMAFKALPVTSSVTVQNRNNLAVSEIDAVRSICVEIERAMMAIEEGSSPGHVEKKSVIEEQDIISLDEAKKRTGYLEHLVYDFKKLVWA